MDGGSIGNGAAVRLVVHASEEIVALDNHVDRGRHQQFHSAHKGVDVNLFVLADHRLAQVQAQAAAEGVKTGAMESLATVDILVGAQTHVAAHALTVLAMGHGTLEPL